MLSRITTKLLSWIGFGVPAPPASAILMESLGNSDFAFVPGKKLHLEAGSKEVLDARLKQICDEDVVWPGKSEVIFVENRGEVARRYEVSLTDLDSAYYVRMPAKGGTTAPEGGVLLQPGERADFEIKYLPVVEDSGLRSQLFNIVVTSFNPHRLHEAGEVEQDLPGRWVALPTMEDFPVRIAPQAAITRPWRRQALFHLELENRSELKASLGLHLIRAAKKEELATPAAENVGTLTQVLEPGASGICYWTLPPCDAGSYFAIAKGTAQTAATMFPDDGPAPSAAKQPLPIALKQPVEVMFFPWRSLAKDWVFLMGALLLLFWLIFGIPVPKQPVIHLTIKGVRFPPGGKWEDIHLNVIDINGNPLDKSIPAVPEKERGEGSYLLKLPVHWYGYRYPSAWSWINSGSKHLQYRLAASVDEDKKQEYAQNDLSSLRPDKGQEFQTDISRASLLGEWRDSAVGTVPLAPEQPQIHSVKPEQIQPPGKLTISGRAFGRVPGLVLLNGKPVHSTNWTGETVEVLVPKATPGGLMTVDLQMPDHRLINGGQSVTILEEKPRSTTDAGSSAPRGGGKGAAAGGNSGNTGGGGQDSAGHGGQAKSREGSGSILGGNNHKDTGAGGPSREEVKIDPAYVTLINEYLKNMKAPDFSKKLAQEMKAPGGLALEVTGNLTEADHTAILSITPTKRCYWQLYEVKFSGDFAPILAAVDGKKSWANREGATIATWLQEGNAPSPLISQGYNQFTKMFIVIAREAGDASEETSSQDLLDLLQHGQTKGMAISGYIVNQQPNAQH